MKQLLLFLSLLGMANALNAQTHEVAFRSDHQAYLTIQGIYEKYVQNMHEKINTGEIKAFDSKSMKSQVELIYVIGTDWLGIRFDKKYLTILITDDKTAFIKKDDLSKLDVQSTQLLSYVQDQAKLKWVTYQTIENNVYKLYDKLQEYIYTGIMAGKLKIYNVDSLALEMPISLFDTAFDQEHVEWDETLGDYLNYGKEEFTAERIIGTCRLENSGIYYGITYTPLNEPDQNYAPMCWIIAKDLKAFLDKEEWLFFEVIWGGEHG